MKSTFIKSSTFICFITIGILIICGTSFKNIFLKKKRRTHQWTTLCSRDPLMDTCGPPCGKRVKKCVWKNSKLLKLLVYTYLQLDTHFFSFEYWEVSSFGNIKITFLYWNYHFENPELTNHHIEFYLWSFSLHFSKLSN